MPGQGKGQGPLWSALGWHQHRQGLVGTARLGHAVGVHSLTAAADGAAVATCLEREVGPATGYGLGALQLEGPTAGGFVLASGTPVHAVCGQQCRAHKKETI